MSAATLSSLLDAWAKERPDATAIASLSRPPLSHAAFAAASRRVAEGLSRQGIGPGDRVALLLPNRPEMAVLLVALARLSAIAVPLDPRFGVEEIATFLSRARASAVAVAMGAAGWGTGQAPLAQRLAEVLPDTRAPLRFVIGLDTGGATTLAGLPVVSWPSLDAVPEYEGEAARAEAAFLALPAAEGRLAMHRQQSVAAHARAVAERLGLDASESGLLAALPWAAPTGMAAVMSALLSGTRLLCQEEAGGAAADSLARAHRATHLLAWPATWVEMAPLAERRPYPALVFAGCDGTPPDSAAVLSLRRVWGMAETQGLFATAEDGPLIPVGPAELRLGEALEIRSPSLLCGWLGEDAHHEEEAFFGTGVPAALDGDGFALSEGGPLRLEDMVIRPEEVARFLRRQPEVEEAVVVAASPEGALVGFLRATAEAEPDAAVLLARCRHAFAPAKVPARLAFVEHLPDEAMLNDAAAALVGAA
ncbi:AMP-binding enzyme [Acetobacteraceae bacterium AT-5844]|nr:AMP-binding enzyme [Acetobacteraceae bacterium AT-5844]